MGRKWHGFSVDIEFYFIVVWVVETDLISVWGSELTRFQRRDQNWLGFVGGLKITLFRIWIEINFVFVSGGIENVSAENCLVFKNGSKLICFLFAGRKFLVLSVRIDWLDFCVGGQKWRGFCMRARNHLVFVWASKLTCFLCRWSELTWFQCGRSILYERTKQVRASNPTQRWPIVLSVLNEQTRSGVQIPPKSYFCFFGNASPHSSQALTKPVNFGGLPSYIILNITVRRHTGSCSSSVEFLRTTLPQCERRPQRLWGEPLPVRGVGLGKLLHTWEGYESPMWDLLCFHHPTNVASLSHESRHHYGPRFLVVWRPSCGAS